MSKVTALAQAKAVATGTTTPTQTSVQTAPNPTPEAQKATPLAETPLAEGTVPSSLAKKEAELVKQRAEFKKHQQEFEAKQKRADEILKIGQEFNDLRAKDPIGALRKLGFSETEIFNYLAQAENPKEPTPEEKAAAAAEAAVQAKIDKWNQQRQAEQTQESERRDQAVLTQFKGQISSLISSNPEKYEYCAFEGPSAEALIYETVLQSVAASNGQEAITAEEAAELVENYYEERDKGMANLKKRQPTPTPVQAPSKPERTRTVDTSAPGTSPAKPIVQRARTITNSATATVASTTVKRPETPAEKRTRLEAWLRDGVNPGRK